MNATALRFVTLKVSRVVSAGGSADAAFAPSIVNYWCMHATKYQQYVISRLYSLPPSWFHSLSLASKDLVINILALGRVFGSVGRLCFGFGSALYDVRASVSIWLGVSGFERPML